MSLTERYTQLQLIQNTVCGDLYSAVHAHLGRRVALRVFQDDNTSGARPRIADSIRAASQLVHPNIAAPFDAEFTDESFYFASDPEGTPLREVLQDAPPLALRLQVARALAAAITHAHQHGVLHGSLNPSRVSRDAGGTWRVGDFGLSAASSAPNGKQVAFDADTTDYLPARVLRRPETFDAAADAYCLGAVLGELLTGVVPDAGKVDRGRTTCDASVLDAIDVLLEGRAGLDALLALSAALNAATGEVFVPAPTAERPAVPPRPAGPAPIARQANTPAPVPPVPHTQAFAPIAGGATIELPDGIDLATVAPVPPPASATAPSADDRGIADRVAAKLARYSGLFA